VYFSCFLRIRHCITLSWQWLFYNCVISTTQSRILFPLQNTHSDRWSSIFRSWFSGPAFSGPAFSTPDIWSCIFRSFIFFGPPFCGPAFSVDLVVYVAADLLTTRLFEASLSHKRTSLKFVWLPASYCSICDLPQTFQVSNVHVLNN